MGETVDTVFSDLEAGNTAVIVATRGKPVGVLTRADLLEYWANNQARDGT
jgi:predicted transcriptional regulator